MSVPSLDDRMTAALAELRSAIRKEYPTAEFDVAASPDDATSVHLRAIVDVDDPDDVLDLVIDRVLQFQADDGLPIHVIPVRTPGRIANTFGRHPLKRRNQALIAG